MVWISDSSSSIHTFHRFSAWLQGILKLQGVKSGESEACSHHYPQWVVYGKGSKERSCTKNVNFSSIEGRGMWFCALHLQGLLLHAQICRKVVYSTDPLAIRYTKAPIIPVFLQDLGIYSASSEKFFPLIHLGDLFFFWFWRRLFIFLLLLRAAFHIIPVAKLMHYKESGVK